MGGVSVMATRTYVQTTWVGKRARKACTRCGIIRQINTNRHGDLCNDCRASDPDVWTRRSAS